MQVEEVEEVTAFVCSGSRSARRASELQCLGDMPWVFRATAMWPDNRYVASDGGKLNTADNFPIARGAPAPQVERPDHKNISGLCGSAGVSNWPECEVRGMSAFAPLLGYKQT